MNLAISSINLQNNKNNIETFLKVETVINFFIFRFLESKIFVEWNNLGVIIISLPITS